MRFGPFVLQDNPDPDRDAEVIDRTLREAILADERTGGDNGTGGDDRTDGDKRAAATNGNTEADVDAHGHPSDTGPPA